MTSTPAHPRSTLTGISSRAWEHPADRGALVALRRLKGFDTLVRQLMGLVNERAVRLELLGSAVKVDERQFGRLHRQLMDVCRVLDVNGAPECFVSADPYPNAVTIGLEKPIIVLTSGLVDLLDDDEVGFVLGHELGHAISGHAVYQTLLLRLTRLTGVLGAVPGGVLGLRAISAALMEWARKAELSADRAGLLATQDPALAFRVHMKTASGGHLEDLDTTSFLAQGREYAESGDLQESVLRMLLVEARSHPFAVTRAAELRSWVDGGGYTAVLGGDYPRRDQDAAASVSDAARDAAQSYAASFGAAQDAVGSFVRDVAGVAGTVRGWLDQTLRGNRE